MIPTNKPFNITMLQLTETDIRKLGQVSSLDMLESSKQTFNENGLWSSRIFGNIGDDNRNSKFGYIDVKIPVLHPVMYRSLISAKSLYRGIMSGSEYAVWSNVEQDFVKSNPIDGFTGYHFFITHFLQLNLKETGTTKRNKLVRLYEKFKDKSLNRYIIVIPAGLRDIDIQDGRITVDEVNSIYRKLISYSNNITEAGMKNNPELLDSTGLQFKQHLSIFMSIYLI